MTWNFPLKLYREAYVPCDNHPGAFGFKRKYHRHEGVDLYVHEGSTVHAVESGIVVAVMQFTGPEVGSPWWHSTHCVMVGGVSGVVNYGEIVPTTKIGSYIDRDQIVGAVKQVLKKDKGKPMSMLHLELYVPGTREPVEWPIDQDICPKGLLDPTAFLIEARRKQYV